MNSLSSKHVPWAIIIGRDQAFINSGGKSVILKGDKKISLRKKDKIHSNKNNDTMTHIF